MEMAERPSSQNGKENTLKNGEIACNKQILLSYSVFKRLIKTRACLGNG